VSLHDLVEQHQNDEQPFDLGNGAGEAFQFIGFETRGYDLPLAQEILVQMASFRRLASLNMRTYTSGLSAGLSLLRAS